AACRFFRYLPMYGEQNENSEDSETEGGLGNVTRVVMRPPGQSGKAKRGHLCFDASFETGKFLMNHSEYLARSIRYTFYKNREHVNISPLQLRF
ncbi:hypothetical protein L9F63_027007, partial [Diploptera punctata]